MKKGERPPVILEAVWAGMVPAVVLLAGTWLWLGLPAPRCVFHSLTGFPCLTCGMSRGTLLFLRGEWVDAFCFNPLALLAPFALSLFWLYCVAAVFRWVPPLGAYEISFRHQRLLRWGILVFLLCNWGYLFASESWREERSESIDYPSCRVGRGFGVKP